MAEHSGRWEPDVVPREASAGAGDKGWGSPMPPAYGPLEERPSVRENGSRGNGARAENGAGAENGAAPAKRGGAAKGSSVGRGAGAANGAGPEDSNGSASTSGLVRSRRRAERRERESIRRQLKKLRTDVLKPRVKAEPERRIPTWADWNPNGREHSPAPAATGAVSEGAVSAGAPAGPIAVSPNVESVSVPAVAQGADRPVLAGDESPGPSSRTVTHLDVYSIAKVSIVFYLILLVVFVVASVLLWLVADAFGAVDSIQRSIRSLFDVKSYVLHPGTIALYASALGAVLAVAGTIANVLAAVIYNLISEVVGGIRIGVSAAEHAGLAPAPASRRGGRPGRRTGRLHEGAAKGDSLKRT